MTLTRRRLLKQTGWTAGAGAAALLFPEMTRNRLFAVERAAVDPIVETANGKVRGRSVAGIHSFLGIRYGAPTGGRNRFMPPQKPQPWTGIQDAFWYGNSAPQSNPAQRGTGLAGSDIGKLVAGTDGPPPPESEDCLFLNVWTPGVNDAKRPVMFWLHGGGFYHRVGFERALHRRESRPVRRRCGGRNQPSAGRSRFHALGRSGWRTVRSFRQRWHARRGGGAGMGSR
jgi:hypothetical protein